MNRKIISFALAGLFILLFIKNDIVAKGITDGFELWYRAVIPTLFPYMLLGSIVINGGYGYAFRLVGIPLCKILRTGRDNSFCIVAGMLFGLPAGSVFANEMYEYIIAQCRAAGFEVQTGSFGADMKVELLNDGPFTIVLDSGEL